MGGCEEDIDAVVAPLPRLYRTSKKSGCKMPAAYTRCGCARCQLRTPGVDARDAALAGVINSAGALFGFGSGFEACRCL